MRKTKSILISTEEIHLVVCNMCGHEIERNEFGYLDEHINIEKQWGFGSHYDGQTHTIDLCKHCYDKFLDMLNVKPIDKINNDV